MLARFLNHIIRLSGIRAAQLRSLPAIMHLSSSSDKPPTLQRESIQIILTQNPRNFFGNERAAARHVQELERDITRIVNRYWSAEECEVTVKVKREQGMEILHVRVDLPPSSPLSSSSSSSVPN
jgi:septum formation topological specificity factor MinE